MNALSSYLRHLIVTGLVLLVAKYQLPIEGSEEAANVIALAVVGTLAWLTAKYAPPGLAKLFGTGALLLLVCFTLPSCGTAPVSLHLLGPHASLGYSSKSGLSLTAVLPEK